MQDEIQKVIDQLLEREDPDPEDIDWGEPLSGKEPFVPRSARWKAEWEDAGIPIASDHVGQLGGQELLCSALRWMNDEELANLTSAVLDDPEFVEGSVYGSLRVMVDAMGLREVEFIEDMGIDPA